jgi:solute carrier family 29 (equilibrative nucleoside transporter), member 1/2/3
MFLAAAPYFQYRFSGTGWIAENFQSAIIVSSTLVNMVAMIILTRMQKNVSYPYRVAVSLVMNAVIFLLLTLSAVLFRGISPQGYFTFVLFTVAITAVATSLAQNGLFSISSGYGREEYTQAIMAGQGVAGVVPCIVQIVSVLSVPRRDAAHGNFGDPSKSAFSYFLTATAVSLVTLVAFAYLMRHQKRPNRAKQIIDAVEDAEFAGQTQQKTVSLFALCWKLKWFAGGIFLTFAISMFFPVFTEKIYSVTPEKEASRLFQRASFIPLALLMWNIGDLLGRNAPLIPAFNLTNSPKTVLGLALGRVLFIPLYLSCNIKGQGAVINSDAFYLIIVQFLFGLSNGWLGSSCMMAAPEWVEESEREATGGFMGLVLVAGLTVGSLLSFTIAA